MIIPCRYLEEASGRCRFVQRRAEITRDYQNLGLKTIGLPLQDVVREVTSCLLLPGVSVPLGGAAKSSPIRCSTRSTLT